MERSGAWPERPLTSPGWSDDSMALRWTAASFAPSEKNFRRIMGHEYLWMLAAALTEHQKDHQLVEAMKASLRQLIPEPSSTGELIEC